MTDWDNEFRDNLDSILGERTITRATPPPRPAVLDPQPYQPRVGRRLHKAPKSTECHHHPALWVFTWASLSLSVYLAGALIGLPS